ncbi:uncharacterized protein LOC108159132 [Drosophila miranda]|uniref:uncharacterized protein LOC108159132 n=1 Tax=Drosophila miranda TaxID=7229 RepID=UPI00143F1AA9|nr:uncharacterized protein LOC108159132 [Drosophila miranda]
MPAKSAQNIKTKGKIAPGPAGNNAMGRQTKPVASKLSWSEWPLPPQTVPKHNGGMPIRHKITEGSDGHSVGSKDLGQILPVRQKPLGAYMGLASACPMPGGGGAISYAAVGNVIAPKHFQNMNIVIPPRVKKQQKPHKAANRRATVDPKFTIFDVEEPKPHLVILYAKDKTNDEEVHKMPKNSKKHQKLPQKPLNPQDEFQEPNNATQNELQEPQNDAPKELQNVRTKSSSTETNLSEMNLQFLGVSIESTESEDTLESNPAPNRKTNAPEFSDSESYLRYQLRKLQQILATQCSDSFWIKRPRSLKPSKCERYNYQLDEKQL